MYTQKMYIIKEKVIESMEEKTSLRESIKEDLRKRIAGMENDEALPSEIRLAEYYNTSRTTIRLAIGELLNEGLLYRIKGSGTYKQLQSGLIPSTQILGFTEELKKVHSDVHLEGVTVEAATLPPSKAQLLGVAVGSKCWKFTRSWVVDGKVFAYGVAYFRRDLLPEFAEEKIHLSLLETLREEYGQEIVGITNHVMAQMPDETLQRKLSVGENQPLLVCESIEENSKGEKLYVDTRYHSAANYVYSIRQYVEK